MGVIRIKLKFLTQSDLFVKALADIFVEYISNLFTAVTKSLKGYCCYSKNGLKLTWILVLL